MNLGLERDVIGDILMNDAEAYVFVCECIADYIVDELSQIKLDTGGNSLNDFNIALNTENGTDISLSIDPADIIETLSRERISELTRKLNE